MLRSTAYERPLVVADVAGSGAGDVMARAIDCYYQTHGITPWAERAMNDPARYRQNKIWQKLWMEAVCVILETLDAPG
jgi:hypothetical protein